MTSEEINGILSSTTSEDWLVSEETGAFTYKQDALLRIQQRPIDYHGDKFVGEDWATSKHPDSNAFKAIYDVYYGLSLITTKQLVNVDGGRATLPMPKIRTTVIPWRDYAFARIVASDRLDEYIERSGLTVASSAND